MKWQQGNFRDSIAAEAMGKWGKIKKKKTRDKRSRDRHVIIQLNIQLRTETLLLLLGTKKACSAPA
jgi:hypothetical protein